MTAAIERSVGGELALAREALRDAELIVGLTPRIAAREAYLAMLHAAHARIAATGRKVPATHRGVSIEIGKIYRDAQFPAQQWLAEVETWKLAADYGRGTAAGQGEAEAALTQARAFIERMAADIGDAHAIDALGDDILARLRQIDGRKEAD